MSTSEVQRAGSWTSWANNHTPSRKEIEARSLTVMRGKEEGLLGPEKPSTPPPPHPRVLGAVGLKTALAAGVSASSPAPAAAAPSSPSAFFLKHTLLVWPYRRQWVQNSGCRHAFTVWSVPPQLKQYRGPRAATQSEAVVVATDGSNHPNDIAHRLSVVTSFLVDHSREIHTYLHLMYHMCTMTKGGDRTKAFHPCGRTFQLLPLVIQIIEHRPWHARPGGRLL